MNEPRPAVAVELASAASTGGVALRTRAAHGYRGGAERGGDGKNSSRGGASDWRSPHAGATAPSTRAGGGARSSGTHVADGPPSNTSTSTAADASPGARHRAFPAAPVRARHGPQSPGPHAPRA